MKETLRAIFENGVFRPLKRPKGVVEHREVTLIAGRVSSDDAQEMREIIEREFEHVDPREWR